jgi:hypothetical protein
MSRRLLAATIQLLVAPQVQVAMVQPLGKLPLSEEAAQSLPGKS